MLKFLYLFACLIIKSKEVQSQDLKTYTITEKTFCYNSSLEGFRLNATVLDEYDVSSKSACVDECLAHPCCRSINYKHSNSPYMASECELLHDLVENTSFALEANTSFDHVFIIHPQKEYNASCFPAETYVSCKDAFETYMFEDLFSSSEFSGDDNLQLNFSSTPNGVYYLQLNESSEIYPAYCHMSNLSSQCGGGGWTLVMKLDGDKETFEYSSPLWTNDETLNVEAGLEGLTENETKLASYYNTPFTKVCLGMKVNNVTNWILLNHNASSLYSVIADGNYIETNAGRAEWVSLINGASLQPNCNKEGFNLGLYRMKLRLRIGFAGNNEKDCETCDSFIGFGIYNRRSNEEWKWSSGNINHQPWNDRLLLKSFGYILVQ